MPEILLKNITKKFGDFVAVDNLSMKIEDGDFITLLGPSGCGKTTTLRQIAGLETPTSGEIYIDGVLVFSSEKLIDISPAKRGVGFLFQNYALWPHLTVYQNIAFGLENNKWSKERIKKRVDELLELLKISEFIKRYPAELSGGQQQRVAIARTLATNPKVLLMDEPLSNLDAKLRMEMRAELKRLHKETGATFVYVTHDQLEAMTLATKICLLKDGLLQMFNSPLDVYLKPLNTFVADFVGSPAINLISFKYNKIGKHKIKLVNEFFDFSFESNNELPENLGEEVTIGIRPEYIKVSETGKFEVEVYTSLPSGMETILGLIMNDSKRINCVVFGANDFSVGNMVKVDFIGSEIVLFNDQGIFAALGKLLY